jgi:ABC-2 type transport system permease protein
VSWLFAFLRRDAQVDASYRFSAVVDLANGLSLVVLFFFLGSAVGPVGSMSEWGGDLFAFAVVGVVLGGPLAGLPAMLAARVREGQLTGNLAPILLSPIGPVRALIGLAAWPYLSALAKSLVYVVFGMLVFGFRPHAIGVVPSLAIFGLATIAQFGVALWSCAFILYFKRGDPLGALINQLSSLLGGAWFPVAILPTPLRWLSWMLPVTHALDGTRAALLSSGGGATLARAVGVLAVMAVISMSSGILALQASLWRARRDGSLLHV